MRMRNLRIQSDRETLSATPDLRGLSIVLTRQGKAHNLKDETDLPRDGGLEGWRAGAPA